MAPTRTQDKIQKLRMRRAGLAVVASGVTVLMAELVAFGGYLPRGVAATYAAIVTACCLVFYLAFRTNYNLRFADPTLSTPQLVAAGLAISYLVYHGDGTRLAFMAMYVMAFAFAMFTLSTRGLVALALFYVALDVSVVELALRMKPEGTDPNRETVRILVFACLLAWMTYMGRYVNALHRHLRRTNDELAGALARYQHLVGMSSDWYWEQDTQFRFTRVDGRIHEMFGIDPASVIGKRRWEAGYGDFDPSYWSEHIHTLERHEPFRDFEIVRNDSEGRVVHAALVSGEPVFDDTGAFCGYRGVGRDITERRKMEETVARLAAYDDLTGLPNGRLLARQLDRAIAEARRCGNEFSLLYCDLDGFKPVNDDLGHDAGDQLLREVAARLRTTLREADLIARVGGDEFVALGTTCRSAQDAAHFAERIGGALSAPFRIGEREARISCSLGIARYPADASGAKELLEAADKAMYAAKRSGRGTHAFAGKP
ncbi:MAG: diguanylate cyclase domain-containing protein [Usitatibacter sp.]